MIVAASVISLGLFVAYSCIISSIPLFCYWLQSSWWAGTWGEVTHVEPP